jgi:hypothetical protein
MAVLGKCHIKLLYFIKFHVCIAENIKIKVFDMMSCRLVERLITFRRKLLPPCAGSCFENGGSRFLQHVGAYLPDYMTILPRRLQF